MLNPFDSFSRTVSFQKSGDLFSSFVNVMKLFHFHFGAQLESWVRLFWSLVEEKVFNRGTCLTATKEGRRETPDTWMTSNYFSCPSNCVLMQRCDQTWYEQSQAFKWKWFSNRAKPERELLCWAAAWIIHKCAHIHEHAHSSALGRAPFSAGPILLPQLFNVRWPLCIHFHFGLPKCLLTAGRG